MLENRFPVNSLAGGCEVPAGLRPSTVRARARREWSNNPVGPRLSLLPRPQQWMAWPHLPRFASGPTGSPSFLEATTMPTPSPPVLRLFLFLIN